MQRKSFEKSHISVKNIAKEILNTVKNIDTKVFSAIVSIVMLVSSFGVISEYYTIGYDVYYGDVNVGMISSKTEGEKVYDEAKSDVRRLGGRFELGLRYVLTIAPVAEIADSDIYRGIVVAAEGEEKCYAINSNGVTVAKLWTREDAEEAVRRFVASFNRPDAEVYGVYTIDSDSDIVTEIMTVDEAVQAIKDSGAIKVSYRDIYEEELEIQFDEIIVENPDILEGTQRCVQEGVCGVGVKKYITFYENGVQKHDIEPVVEVVQNPVDRIVHVGTGKMVGLSEDCLIWPAEGTFTSEYGRRWGRNHNGIDIAAKTGTPIVAPAPGVVTFSGTRSGYGNYIMIDHGNGYVTTYAHMNRRYAVEGQSVATGDVIGEIGTTGRVTGAHLHFEVLCNGKFVDPMDYIAG